MTTETTVEWEQQAGGDFGTEEQVRSVTNDSQTAYGCNGQSVLTIPSEKSTIYC